MTDPDLLALVHQYRNDMLYPPAADSRERRIKAIDAALSKTASDGVEVEHPLKKWGFLPGRYTCLCVGCSTMFTGAKRSVRCEACAQIWLIWTVSSPPYKSRRRRVRDD
jgi:hypothetical protein